MASEKNTQIFKVISFDFRATVFQYHVTLALDKPKAALPILNGRLGLTLIGDRALHPNTWRPYPTLFAK